MTAEAADVSEPYDLTTLLEHCLGDPEMAEELLDRFASRLDMFTQSLTVHLDNDDRLAAAAVAHSLKGEAGMLAAHRVQQQAAFLEQALRTHDSTHLSSLWTCLQAEMSRCLAATPAVRQAVGQQQSFHP